MKRIVCIIFCLGLGAAALHGGVMSPFRRPRFFHAYGILAFLAVLTTYFGVNLILGGMHAYA